VHLELIILQSVNDFSTLENSLSTSTEILVFEQEVMIILDEKRIKYKVIEDFYPAKKFYHDLNIYRNKVLNFITKLDKVNEQVIDFPYSFSGNEHYLLTWFDDSFYLEKLIQLIKNQYKKVYLYGPIRPKKISYHDFNFSKFNSSKINGTISFAHIKKADRYIQLIFNAIKVNFIKDKAVSKKNIPIKYKTKFFFNKLKELYFRKLFKIKKNKSSLVNTENKHIYTFQDTHELSYLKKYYLPKFKYSNPVKKLRQKIETEQPQDLTKNYINEILKDFINEHFLFLNENIFLFLNSYQKEIVGRIVSFKEEFKSLIIKDKPNILLLGFGTRDVFDTICCYVANHQNIPVIFFQHGGTKFFFHNRYDKSLEYNNRIFKTLIIKSKKDLNKLQNNETKVICMGSVIEYENSLNISEKKKKNDILYCLGPDPDYSFRQLLNHYSVKKKYKQSLEAMLVAENVSLSIDLKLHPIGEKNSFQCYKKIIKNNKFKNSNIIYGDSVEFISKNYKIFILDFFGSAIIQHIFNLKVPIIFFHHNFDDFFIGNNNVSEIKKRCYVAKNKNELHELLNKFKSGKLNSKWSEDIVDDYIYPIDRGNPGKNIAKYIASIV
jgi:hypothetical protein